MEHHPNLDPSAITDIDTAKFALKWAVERLELLEASSTKLKDDTRNKTDIIRSLTKQLDHKEETVKKWQSTIRTWEENWKSQQAMESDLKSKIRHQIINEEMANWRQAKVQLEEEIKALKGELAKREADIGQFKLDAIEKNSKDTERKEEELKALLGKHEDNLANRELAIRQKYEELEIKLTEGHHRRLSQSELALSERYERKMTGFAELYKEKEQQLEVFRTKLEDEFLEKSDELSKESLLKRKNRIREIAEGYEAKKAEFEHAYEEKIRQMEQVSLQKHEEILQEIEKKEKDINEEKEVEISILKENHQREVTEIRNRLQSYIQNREQEYVDMRLNMEAQVVEIIKKHDSSTNKSYQEAIEEIRQKWSDVAKENQKEIQTNIDEINRKWEKDWQDREQELTGLKETEIKAIKGRLEAEADLKEEQFRALILKEQNEWMGKQAIELESAKKDIEKSYSDRIGIIKQSIEKSYKDKENSLIEHYDKVQENLKTQEITNNEHWLLEKEQTLQSERENLKEEFSSYRSKLYEKLMHFEDELKLKYGQHEIEAQNNLDNILSKKEKEIETILGNKKETLAEEFKLKEVKLLKKEKEANKILETERKTLIEKFNIKEAELSEKEKETNKMLENKKETFIEEFKIKEAQLSEKEKNIEKTEKELKAHYAQELAKNEKMLSDKFEKSLQEERQTIEKKIADKEQLLAEDYDRKYQAIKKEKEKLQEETKNRIGRIRSEFEANLIGEKKNIAEANKKLEADLKNKIADLDKTKTKLQEDYSQLKIKLYQDLQDKEHKNLQKLGNAQQEMHKTLLEHRAEADKQYDKRFEELKQKERDFKTYYQNKTDDWVVNFEKEKEETLSKLSLQFEQKTTELQKAHMKKEADLDAVFSGEWNKLETEHLEKEKKFTEKSEKILYQKRQELETHFKNIEIALEKRQNEMESKLDSEWEKTKNAWEGQKIEILNKDRQALRSTFEKKEAVLSQEFETELSKNKDYKLKLDEEFQKKRQEMEQFYYGEIEKSRAVLEKTRGELEIKIKEKFKELEDKKNKLTMAICQKEEEYADEYQKKETQLYEYWNKKNAELKEKYEKRIEELTQKNK